MIRRNYKPFGFLVFAAILFASCTNPLQRHYTLSSYDEDMQDIKKSNKISDEDEAAIDKYIMLARLTGNDVSGSSYEEILEQIKIFEQKNEQAYGGSAAEQDDRRQRLSAYIDVQLVNKAFTKINDKNVLAYTISFKNTSLLKIKTVTGNLIFYNLLDKPFKSLPVFIDEDIDAKKVLVKTISCDYNDGDESDRRLRIKDASVLKSIWYPEKIIYENGIVAQ